MCAVDGERWKSEMERENGGECIRTSETAREGGGVRRRGGNIDQGGGENNGWEVGRIMWGLLEEGEEYSKNAGERRIRLALLEKGGRY